MKTSAKLQAILDIKMDPEFQQKQKENAMNGMGTAYPGKTRIEHYSQISLTKLKKQNHA